ARARPLRHRPAADARHPVDAYWRADPRAGDAAVARRERGTPPGRVRPFLTNATLAWSSPVARATAAHARHAAADGGGLCAWRVFRLLAATRPAHDPRPGLRVRPEPQSRRSPARHLFQSAVDPAGVLLACDRRGRGAARGTDSSGAAEGADRYPGRSVMGRLSATCPCLDPLGVGLRALLDAARHHARAHRLSRLLDHD